MRWWKLQQLKSKAPETRLQALEKLAEEDPSANAAAFLDALQDSDPHIRKAAAEALGQSREERAAKPLMATNVGGNRFKITARALNGEEAACIAANALEVNHSGVANYYDSQRFGGGAAREELPGRSIIKRDFEGALKLHLAVPRRKQSLRDKRVRKECAAHWGEWDKLMKKLPRSSERSVIGYLVEHADDFRGALDRVDERLLTLYLAAYQSLLFNDSLVALVAASVPQDQTREVKYQGGTMLLWRTLDDATLAKLRETKLPLLAHSTKLDEFSDDAQLAVNAALERDGAKLEDLVVKGLDKVRLRPAERAALIMPADLSVSDAEPDELNEDRLKVTVSFVLPRGAFATVVMKRLGMK